jgi:hypothetical protein
MPTQGYAINAHVNCKLVNAKEQGAFFGHMHRI